jgi:hypothetical protein
MSSLIFEIISEGLVLINKLVPSEAIRIQERLNDYKRQWDEEISKGALRNDAKLDYLDNELRYTGDLFVTALKSASLADKS